MANGRCDHCDLVRINGIRCHETGCPAAWRDETRECKECGSPFEPDDRRQVFCSVECYGSHWGYIDGNVAGLLGED